MEMKSLIDKIFQKGREKGLNDMEVYYSAGSSLTLKVFQKELETYNLSESEGLSLRGVYKGKMGYSYTEKVDETSIDQLVRDVLENAVIIDSDDEEFIFEGSKEYIKVDSFNPALSNVSEEKKIEFERLLDEVEQFKPGDKVEGTVTRITPFGAFVQLSSAVEALVHVSELGGDGTDPEKIFTLNERKDFVILDVDKENRKISLSLADAKKK